MSNTVIPTDSDIELSDGEAWHKEILFEMNANARAKGAEYDYDFLEDAPRASAECRYAWRFPTPQSSSFTQSGSDSNVSTDSESLENSYKQKKFSSTRRIDYNIIAPSF
jgi:hypothetical protein